MYNTDKIIDIICKHTEVEREFIEKKTRKREAVLARQISFNICYNKLKGKGMTLEEVGSIFQIKYDHSTVLYAIKEINERVKIDKGLRKLYEEIVKEVNIRVFHLETEDEYLKSLIRRRAEAIKLIDNLEVLIDDYEKYN